MYIYTHIMTLYTCNTLNVPTHPVNYGIRHSGNHPELLPKGDSSLFPCDIAGILSTFLSHHESLPTLWLPSEHGSPQEKTCFTTKVFK